MGDSTLDQTAYDSKGFSNNGGGGSNTVRAHSFVVGKKVCNQTTIDLLTTESAPTVGEESKNLLLIVTILGPNPIKVIFVKPNLAAGKEQQQQKHGGS